MTDLVEKVADALREYAHKQGVVRSWDDYAKVAIPLILSEAAAVAVNSQKTALASVKEQAAYNEACRDIAEAIQRLAEGRG